jgi:hypothetical protein
LLSVTTQYTTNKEADGPLPTLGGRETVTGSSKAAPSSITIQEAMKDVKGGKKRRKWYPQWVATTAIHDDDDNDKQANSFDMECIMTVERSVKHQAQPLIDHFERLLEAACPNHAYPIKHKLKDCSLMKNFMVLESLTRDMKPEEDLGKGDVMPTPGRCGHDDLR